MGSDGLVTSVAGSDRLASAEGTDALKRVGGNDLSTFVDLLN